MEDAMKSVALSTLWVMLNTGMAAQVHGQNGPGDEYSWFSIHAGPAVTQDFSAGMSWNFGDRYLYQVAFNTLGEISTFGGAPFFAGVSSAIGKGTSTRWMLASAFAGPSIIIGKEIREIENTGQRDFFTVGFTINGQLHFRPISWLGIGVDLYGNVNPVSSGLGLRVGFAMIGATP